MTHAPQGAGFSPRTCAALDKALHKAEQARDAYAALTGAAQQKALDYALANPARLPAQSVIGMVLGTLPDAQWNKMLADSVASAETDAERATMSKIQAMPKADAIRVFAFVSESHLRFADPRALRRVAGDLSNAYAKVESIHPLSVLTKSDKLRVLQLAKAALDDTQQPLVNPAQPWAQIGTHGQIDFYRRVLDKAFPGEQVATLPILPFTGMAQMAAAYIAGADTMIVGPLAGREQNLALHLVSHEYQHRHQKMLCDKLAAGQLTPGTLDFYRARLFQINFKGGYLAPGIRGESKLAQLAGIREYMKQPVEANAFAFGVAFNRAYEPKMGRMLDYMTRAQRGIAGIAAPIDSVVTFFRRLMGKQSGPALSHATPVFDTQPQPYTLPTIRPRIALGRMM